jgi:prevent-host-death family protein
VTTYNINMTTVKRRRSGGASFARETAVAAREVGVRELKARLSEYLREVKSGRTVVVTEHGRPVARLVPEPVSVRDRMLALARAGEIVWSGQRFKPAGPAARVRGSRSLSDLIVEERDERE